MTEEAPIPTDNVIKEKKKRSPTKPKKVKDSSIVNPDSPPNLEEAKRPKKQPKVKKESEPLKDGGVNELPQTKEDPAGKKKRKAKEEKKEEQKKQKTI